MKAIRDEHDEMIKRICDVEEATDNVKANYIKRFEQLTEKLNEVKIDVVREIGEVKLLIQSKA
jgi:hypothetical protein